MSILLAPDDADASTLAAVLAFIDSAGDSAPDSVDPSSTASQLPEKAAAVKYTTEFQRKKRAEIAALREQAEELEERLAHLQHARATPSRADDGSGASLPANAEALMMWRETARDEHGKRLRAEQLNRKLKEVAKHYLQLGDDVLGVLKKRRRPEADYRVLLGTPEPPRYPTLPVNISTPLMDAMRQGMSRLLAESRSVFPANPSSRVTSSFETVRSATGAAACIEIRTATPVQYSALETSDMIWRCLYTTGLRLYAHKRHVMIPGRDGQSVEKKFTMMVPSPVEKHHFANELGVRLTGMHLIHRYGTFATGTSVVVTSAVVVFPPHGRVFREHKWMKVSPLSSDPSRSTAVVETCYRVYPGECNDSSGLDAEDQDAAFYLRTLSANTRLVMQRDQNAQLAGEMFYQAPQ